MRLVGGDRVTVDPATVPAGVERLAVAVALDAGTGGGLAHVPDLGVTVADGTQRIVARAEGLTTERAAVLVEIYRRGDGWKVRSVSAGWSEGLAALVREHGVTVDDEPQGAPEVRTAPGEEKLSLVKRQQLDLRKREVHKVLLTKGAAGERARVAAGDRQDRFDAEAVPHQGRAPRGRADGARRGTARRRRHAGAVPLRAIVRAAARFARGRPRRVAGGVPAPGRDPRRHRLRRARELQRRDPDHDRDRRRAARAPHPHARAVLHRRRLLPQARDHRVDPRCSRTCRPSGSSSASGGPTTAC